MDNKARGEQIRTDIVSALRSHPIDITNYIANSYAITPQAVNSHIQKLEKEGWIQSTGSGKGKRYYPGDLRANKLLFAITADLAEDEIWRMELAYIFDDVPQNVRDICHYGFTEMVNNVIDHSGGQYIYLSVTRDREKITLLVVDDGEGIFHKIKRLCALSDERQALLELSKGKLTTDPDNHTGEGIFFTSRVFDEFEIDSKGVRFSHDGQYEFDSIDETEVKLEEIGTAVYMMISRAADRELQMVFDAYAGPDEYHFNKTVIPVRLAQYGDEKLMSRSQAKRLLARIERFQYVIFDFADVTLIGQAFADEIFRVYANNHPEIQLTPRNMAPDVENMVKRAVAARGAA